MTLMAAASNDSDLWIRRYHPCPDAPARLVCFAHAGGSASYFFPVSAALAPGIDVLVVQYPGRQDRRGEALIDDIHVLADRIVDALASWTDRPMMFFGHSMGAVLAYETTRRLDRNGTAPKALFVSGRRSPTTFRSESVHRRDDAGLLSEVRRLSGTESQLLADEEIVQMVLPALRNDYRAIETYEYRAGPPVSCPIVALIGDVDPRVDADEARDWQRHTAARFDLRVFPGGHFYLNANQGAIVDLLTESAASLS